MKKDLYSKKTKKIYLKLIFNFLCLKNIKSGLIETEKNTSTSDIITYCVNSKLKIKIERSWYNLRKFPTKYLFFININDNNIFEEFIINISNFDIISIIRLKIFYFLYDYYLSKNVRQQLKYKCEWYGRDLIIIDKWFPSSKLCNVCGYKYQKLSLNEREWICPDCKTTHNRDYNAATNIMKEGQRIIGTRYPEYTLVDNPTMDDRLSDEVLKSSGWMKQEEKNTVTKFL